MEITARSDRHLGFYLSTSHVAVCDESQLDLVSEALVSFLYLYDRVTHLTHTCLGPYVF